MREMCVLCVKGKLPPCKMHGMEFCPCKQELLYPECKDCSPDKNAVCWVTANEARP